MACQPIGFLLLLGEFMNGNVTVVNRKLHDCGLEWEKRKTDAKPLRSGGKKRHPKKLRAWENKTTSSPSKALKARDKSPLVIELIYHQVSHTHWSRYEYHLFIAAGNAILRGTKEYNITDFPSHQALRRDKQSQSCYWTLMFHILKCLAKIIPGIFQSLDALETTHAFLEQQQRRWNSRSDLTMWPSSWWMFPSSVF